MLTKPSGHRRSNLTQLLGRYVQENRNAKKRDGPKIQINPTPAPASNMPFNPRRHRPFRILPRHKGGTTPLAVSPLIELELRKNERVARRETKRLVYELKVLGQPVISEVRSSAEK